LNHQVSGIGRLMARPEERQDKETRRKGDNENAMLRFLSLSAGLPVSLSLSRCETLRERHECGFEIQLLFAQQG
jgi:hypothetical protein